MTLRDLQAARDQLEVNDRVLISKGGHQYYGTVIELMAKMAKVRLAKGSKVECVSYAQLSKVVEASEETQPQPLTYHKRSPTADWPVKAVVQVENALATVGILAVQPGEVTTKDYKTWLAEGIGIARGMQDAIDDLANKERELLRESNALLEEADRLAKEASAVAKERQVLHRQFDQLMQLAGKVSK